MHASGIGPLSYGQLHEWREIEGLPRERWQEANTWSRWLLPDGVGTERVRQALCALAVRHPSLHTIYDFTDPASPRQLIAPFDDVAMAVAERGTDGDAAAMVAELFNRPFDLRAELGWRALVVADGGRPKEVLLVWHHMIADGGCDSVLERDFRAFLRDPAPGPPAAGPLDLATWQRAEQQGRARAAAVAYWERVVTSGTAKGFPGVDPSRAGALQCRLRSRLAHARSGELAARTGTSLSSVVLAAFTLAVARATGVERLVAHSMCSNRFLPQWREVVTSMIQPVAVPVTVADDLAEHVSRVHRTAMTAYRHGMYDVDAVAELRAAAGYKPTVAYNFFSWLDDSGPLEEDPEPAWEEPDPIGNGCYLRVASEDGTWLKLCLRTGGLEKEVIAAIMKHLHTLLTAELC